MGITRFSLQGWLKRKRMHRKVCNILILAAAAAAAVPFVQARTIQIPNQDAAINADLETHGHAQGRIVPLANAAGGTMPLDALQKIRSRRIDSSTLKTRVDEWLSDEATARANYGEIGDWDVSAVTEMRSMFSGRSGTISFNGDIANWDVSAVTDMYSMFGNARAFNGDIGSWDTAKVTEMGEMFYSANAFNSDLSSWDVSRVEYMNSMFSEADIFNGNIGSWDTSKVIDMRSMFYEANAFNGDIAKWNTVRVTDMTQMFRDAPAFNGDIGSWDTAGVTEMYDMFRNAVTFNSDISTWNTSGAIDLGEMFVGALSFNQDLTTWDLVGANLDGFFDETSPILDFYKVDYSRNTIVYTVPRLRSSWDIASNASSITLNAAPGANSGAAGSSELTISYAWPGVWQSYTLGATVKIELPRKGEDVHGAPMWGWDEVVQLPSETSADNTALFSMQIVERVNGTVIDGNFGTVLANGVPGEPLAVQLSFSQVGRFAATLFVVDVAGENGASTPLRRWNFTVCPGLPNWNNPAHMHEIADADLRLLYNRLSDDSVPAECLDVSSTTTTITTTTLTTTTITTTTVLLDVSAAAAKRKKDTMMYSLIGGGALLFLILIAVVAVAAIRYYTNPIRLASLRKNDPLSKIGSYIADNRKSLRESVRSTIKFKERFDAEYRATCQHEFDRNPALLANLGGVHQRIRSRLPGRLGAGGLLVQPPMEYDYETDLNGAEHDEDRIETQKKYLASLYSMVEREEPTVNALLQSVTADYFSKNPAISTAEVHLVRGPLKQMDRILEKADLKKHHFEELRDYARASWIVDSVSRVPALLQRLEEGDEFDIVRCKNRFDPTYNSVKSGGYRDYQLVLRTRPGAESLLAAPLAAKLKPISCAWLCEVQIMTKGFHDLKMGIAPLHANKSDNNLHAAASDDGGKDSDAHAHKAYTNFRKFQELSDRIDLQSKEMKQDLDLKQVAQAIPEKQAKRARQRSSGKVFPAAIAESHSETSESVIFLE